MAGILLTNTYFQHLDPKQERKQEPYPPLATLYAAAVLREAGVDVRVHDTVFDRNTDAIKEAIRTQLPHTLVIYDDGFNYLTKMCLVNMRNACFDMIRFAKAQGCRVIVSSSDATDHTKDYLSYGADVIIIGEAEITLRELVLGELPLDAILGIAVSREGTEYYTAKRTVLSELDILPFPAWDLINLRPYQEIWRSTKKYFSLNMTTTRGCPFKCNWCAKPIYGNRYHSRSPEHVVQEIAMLINQYQVEHFWFCDDIFGLKPGWIHKFSQLVQAQNLSFRFKIQCRADLLLDENNIADLAASGCDEIWIGAESGSQKILDAMDKGTTVAQIRTSTQIMKKHGIKPCFFLQFGYPGEEQADIQMTLDLVRECKPFDIGISISYPLPGTKFYERVREQLSAKQNWNDSDELLLMYRGTFSPEYYKHLHRYVHKRFRTMQGWNGLLSWMGLPTGYWKMPLRRIVALPYNTMMLLIYKFRLRTD